MWNLLKNDKECRELRDLLEDAAAARPEAVSIMELSEAMSAAAQTHIGTCASCQEAAQDLLATREIFKGVASNSEMERPWFATRVLAAIPAQQRELSKAPSTGLALPRVASLLAFAADALPLLA